MRFQFLLLGLCSIVCARPADEASHGRKVKKQYQNYGSEKVNGVNIGGWAILEPWITPSIFENVDQSLGIVDEYTLCQNLPSQAASILNAHWSTFYTLADFQAIAATGINTIRIPVGYWSFFLAPGDPYIQGFETYLDQAIGWAQQTGLKVWIDLHGAPGSQNGNDNSGRRGPIDWPAGQNVQYTEQVVQIIVSKYAAAPYAGTVVGIELLNEPNGEYIGQGLLEQYYGVAIPIIQQANSDMLFIVHDAFLSWYDWTYLSNPADNPLAVLDTHQYQVFGTDFKLGDQIYNVCGVGTNISYVEPSILTVVGEFSGAQTDCTNYLNGYGIGSRYEGKIYGATYHGNCATTGENGQVSGLTSTQRTNTRKFIEAQLDAWDQGAGWVFWTAKTESSPYWDYLQLISAGIFPQPFTDRQFPGQCGY